MSSPGVEAALRAEHEGFGQRGGVESHQKVRRELRQRRAADRSHAGRPLRDGGEDGPTRVDERRVAAREDRAIAALDHGAGPAHRRVEEANPRRASRLGEAARQGRRDRAHLDQGSGAREDLQEPARTEDGRLLLALLSKLPGGHCRTHIGREGRCESGRKIDAGSDASCRDGGMIVEDTS